MVLLKITFILYYLPKLQVLQQIFPIDRYLVNTFPKWSREYLTGSDRYKNWETNGTSGIYTMYTQKKGAGKTIGNHTNQGHD